HAGTYGCNQLFYLSLHYATQMQLDAPIGFIHVPSLPEQVLNTPQMPNMPLNIIKDGLNLSLDFLVHWMQDS
ncbi:MAG: pyroglutamyl-peptidase I, partial [Candidatus Hodarchaeota archaeon]